MPLLQSSDTRPVHFVGIAGAGMSALAELFVRRGASVTGCDAAPAHVADLERFGITVVAGHDPSHVEGARAIVVTSAVRKDHPELMRARVLGIPVIRRAEALAEAVSGPSSKLVGIAGTHGKTTTTVMTTEALIAAGLEPTGVAGGRVGSWGGNLLFGSDAVFVVEADEYDRSFLALSPSIAVVTNVEADHLDIYADLADIRSAFAAFIAGAGQIVLCADDEGANTIDLPAGAEVTRYGIDSAAADLVARAPRAHGNGSAFSVEWRGKPLGEVRLAVPGAHNIRNSLAAIASGLALGADFERLAQGLGAFVGVERRFQRLGEVNGVTVVDDYAHHPTEIRATMQAARAAFAGRRIIAAFQPHLFSRTRDFAREIGAALSMADAAYLTAIYPAREKPITGVTSALVEREMRRLGTPPAWSGERTALAEALAAAVRPGDVVLTIGAGDITLTGPELIERLGSAK